MLIVASIFIYIIAIIFKLLDNSAGLLIAHGISVSPFYLRAEIIKEQIANIDDKRLIRKLNRNLSYQKLHKVFTVLAILSLIVGIVLEIVDPYLIYLL